ncbi:MAG: HlyD family secretion protein, partial [Parvularculaceae bacterium]|nr:HlyD family secretion protein [Parvularculaceae bacterium]
MADGEPAIDATKATTLAKATAPRARRLAVMIGPPVLLALGVAAAYGLNAGYVATDNAYVRQAMIPVSPEVGGRIVEVAVRENQRVAKGDLLFRIDPEPYRIAAAQADATIAAAQVKVESMARDLAASEVEVAARREDVAFFSEDYRRQAALLKAGYATRARLQSAEHALEDARGRLSVALAEVAKKRADMSNGPAAPQTNPAILAGEAQKARALMDLRRTELRAPASGLVAQADRLKAGTTITQGLPALTIVVDGSSWIEANFKETDLKNMRPGQPVAVKIDAYPGVKLTGRVASIGAGTGSEFSVLPSQNASGNWVKVTQRVPVRIAIDG